VPYFIAAHPGTTDEDMLNLALWLKTNDFRPDQVQTFTPTPLAMATAMYHTRKNPLRKVTRDSETVETPRSGVQRKLHKALLRYHDPAGHDLIRDYLHSIGRDDLIGNGPHHLVPRAAPARMQRTQQNRRTPGNDYVHAITAQKPRTGAPKTGRPVPRKPARGR
jgi:hypothetical protein